MSEIRGGGGGVDPSQLHLKKELTAIRKAARVLRDPGTTSSWRSPLTSSTPRSIDFPLPIQNNNNTTTTTTNTNARDKGVFLYNWRYNINPISSSDKSAATKSSSDLLEVRTQQHHHHHHHHHHHDHRNDEDDDNDGSLSSTPEDSLGNDGESRSDTYLSHHYTSRIFKCRDTNLISLGPQSQSQSIRRRTSKKNVHQKKQMIGGANSKGLPSISLGSDDTEEYYNSVSAASPLLLSRLKHKNWSHSSSKFLRSHRKEDSSYSCSTPALSTSSYNPYGNRRNPSTVGSWDGTTASFNDGDDEVDDPLDLPGRRGCGIPCYWSKRTPKHRGGVCGSCYSPSLSDTLRRKGSSILCGSQTMYRRRHRSSSGGSNKRRIVSRTARGLLPLLPNSCDGRGGSSIGTGHSDDELSTNFGELDLEALSRLDGRRWSSSCRSQEGLELVALTGEGEEEGNPENIRSLSQKYKPMFFDELIGQNIVVQSLVNAISRGRISPVYLFQGPRGTGKTSTARIFAAALNCLATEGTKPCGICRECIDFISGKSRDIREVDGTNKKGIDRVRYILKSLLVGPPSAFSRYRIFVVDECHLLPAKTWLAFLKFLEEPLPRVVFIFITTDLDSVPRTILSRCQKYLFNKIKDGEIVTRLRKISADENLDVELDALDLIALNADGSLRDAETMLDQLSLLGKRITTSLVNELVGVVSDEKLLELLDLAMSSDTAETVKRARELMDSGVDPMVLMSQLAGLIMDIIAGTYHIVNSKYGDSFFGGRSLTEAELERLKHALKLLSEAEKQLRVSSERSTWFTATLLQLGSVPSPDHTQSGSSRRQSSKTNEEDPSSAFREATVQKQKPDVSYVPRKSTSPASLPKTTKGNPTHRGDLLSLIDGFGINSKPTHSRFMDGGGSVASHDNVMVGNMIFRCINSDKLDDIWVRCIERCHSKTLRQLLHTHGKLVSISEVEGVLVAYIAFGDGDIKSRAEGFLSSITDSIEIVLRRNVEVRIILLPNGEGSINSAKPVELPDSSGLKQMETTAAIDRERKAVCTNIIDGCSDINLHQEPLKVSRGSFNDSEYKLKGGTRGHSNCSPPLLDGTFQSTIGLPMLSAEGNAEISGKKDRKPDIPIQRIESIIREHRLETAWLQAAEKGTPGSMSRLKPEKNQVLPQDGIYHQNQMGSMNSMGLSSQHWEDELEHEIKVLKINDGRALQKDQIGKRVDHYPMSPSLLHDSNFVGNFSKESLGYESGSGTGGCNGLFCWNNTKPRKRGKVKQGTPVRSHKGGRLSWFGECGKSKTESRFRR